MPRMKRLWPCLLLFAMGAIAQSAPPPSNQIHFTEWDSWGPSQVTINVLQGEWLEIHTRCVTGGWDKCDQPAYFLPDKKEVVIPQIGLMTDANGTTEQVFGMFIPETQSDVVLFDPILYNGIPYIHTLEIRSKPAP
jgi:hypothetical protein